ncbi:hypothetical protein [Dyadobacter sp. CY356]|uniref:hypothetical protein n=1 Tax=Dyadobacter sp. CY356 TaxID=2906442 RepID=UPI001F433056|nr:hypothetical protein [Dyadobacter sp. CY356]MCF0058579.1 hypothetical protein [Dyadobacter sp. CY356]
MKKIIIIGCLWFICLACRSENDKTPQAQEQYTSVTYRRLTTVSVSGIPLNVTLLEVNDSRCPINASCISAGSVNVKFNITDGTYSTSAVIALVNDNKDTSTQIFKLGGQKYSIKMQKVSPYPELPQTSKLEEYQVSITIAKI